MDATPHATCHAAHAIVILTFKDVGRDKKTWTRTINHPPLETKGAMISIEDIMLDEVIRSGALMSRDVDVCLNEDRTTASIFAGVRPVGTVTITQDEPHRPQESRAQES